MTKLTVRVLLFLGLMGNGAIGSAQSYLHQVFILNEGWSNWQTGEVMEPATLGVYDPGLQSYTVADTLENAGFVSDALLREGQLFVAADGQLLKYDADTYEVLASVNVNGIRQLAYANGNIYLTRGDVDADGMNQPFDAYLQWFNAETLLYEGELTTAAGPQFATEGIEIVGDVAYIGINNAFDWGNEVGLMGRFDLITEEYEEWDLGVEGKNPNRLFAAGDAILTVNNRDYGSTSLSVLDASLETVETVVVSDANAGCLAAVLDGTTLKYQITGEGQVRATELSNPAESTVWLADAPGYYGVALDPTTGDWYGSVTDYSTFGFVEIRNADGVLLNQFDCGVSPGVICMDVRTAASVIELPQDAGVKGLPVDILGRWAGFNEGKVQVVIDSNGAKTLRFEE